MKTVFNLRKTELFEKEQKMIEKKLTRLNKFFSDDAIATVTVSKIRDIIETEVTVSEKGMYFRAERMGKSVTSCVDEIIDLLIRQIRKNKTRLEKRLYKDAPLGYSDDYTDQEDYNIIRTKKVYLKPISTEDAILEMNMLGHTFFLYVNEDNGKTSLVYKRNDGDYAVLETETL